MLVDELPWSSRTEVGELVPVASSGWMMRVVWENWAGSVQMKRVECVGATHLAMLSHFSGRGTKEQHQERTGTKCQSPVRTKLLHLGTTHMQ
jgi:hypothetical protein